MKLQVVLFGCGLLLACAVRAQQITCYSCTWRSGANDDEACIGIQGSGSNTANNCDYCRTEERYEGENGELTRIDRSCGIGTRNSECEITNQGMTKTCDCDVSNNCNGDGVATFSCYLCDYFTVTGNFRNCREGVDITETQNLCHHCVRHEYFTQRELVHVKRQCAVPGDRKDRCVEEQVGFDTEGISVKRTCACDSEERCNHKSGAIGLYISSASLLVVMATSYII